MSSTKIYFLGPETARWGEGLPRDRVGVEKFVPFLVFSLKKAKKTTKRTRIFPYRTPKFLEKKGKKLKNKEFLAREKTRNSPPRKQGKQGQGSSETQGHPRILQISIQHP